MKNSLKLTTFVPALLLGSFVGCGDDKEDKGCEPEAIFATLTDTTVKYSAELTGFFDHFRVESKGADGASLTLLDYRAAASAEAFDFATAPKDEAEGCTLCLIVKNAAGNFFMPVAGKATFAKRETTVDGTVEVSFEGLQFEEVALSGTSYKWKDGDAATLCVDDFSLNGTTAGYACKDHASDFAAGTNICVTSDTGTSAVFQVWTCNADGKIDLVEACSANQVCDPAAASDVVACTDM